MCGEDTVKLIKTYGLFVLIVWLIQGCTTQPDKEAAVEASLVGDDVILATVNGEPVTRYDLDLTIESTLGARNASKLDESGERKVLESLVSSRAIAQKTEKELSAEEKLALDKKVAAYREQLLVKKHIAKNITPEPATNEMVKEYYDTHPEKFGGKTIRTFEMISTSRNPSQKERDELLGILVKPEDKADWADWVEGIKKQGYPVFFKRGPVVENMLHPKLLDLLKDLEKGQTSAMSFIDGRPYIARIVKEDTIPPRPLAEVSAEIRKSLGPVQLKKAVKRISEDVLKTAQVEYKN